MFDASLDRIYSLERLLLCQSIFSLLSAEFGEKELLEL
jgi:hypothetical protein